MNLRAIGTYERCAVSALPAHDAFSALNCFALIAVVPLLLSPAVAATGRIFQLRLVRMGLGTDLNVGAVARSCPQRVLAVTAGRVALVQEMLLVELLVVLLRPASVPDPVM